MKMGKLIFETTAFCALQEMLISQIEEITDRR